MAWKTPRSQQRKQSSSDFHPFSTLTFPLDFTSQPVPNGSTSCDVRETKLFTCLELSFIGNRYFITNFWIDPSVLSTTPSPQRSLPRSRSMGKDTTIKLLSQHRCADPRLVRSERGLVCRRLELGIFPPTIDCDVTSEPQDPSSG